MECQQPKYLHQRDITVPCGKCAFCLATRRSDWVQRLMQEWRSSEGSAFVTLTYDRKNVPIEPGIAEDGTWSRPVQTLRCADLQKYFKRIRKAGYRIRYYAVGEYGSETFRPHYHVIFFGAIPEDVIRQHWPFGIVHIGKLTLASCGYCTKYVINSRMPGMRDGRKPPFQIMSRRPGIGSSYLTPEMIAWHRADRRNYMEVQGEKRHLPRFYKEKIFSKIDRVRIANRAVRDAIERERKELFKLWKKNKIQNAQAYRERQLQELAMRIRDKSKQNKLKHDVL